jgi:hypothetical protein
MTVLQSGDQQTVDWLKHSDAVQNTPPPHIRSVEICSWLTQLMVALGLQS